MLRINIPAAQFSHVAANTFNQYNLPDPPNGTAIEINGDVILLFEDEQEAVDYLDELEDYAADIDNSSPEKAAINEIITAINSDEFIRAYLQ